MSRSAALMLGAFVLSACGQTGPRVPDRFDGVWSADCASPYVKFAGNDMRVYPDKADYKLKAATFDNNTLKVTYNSNAGTLTDVYAVEGETLRLTATVTPANGEAKWTKRPMSKCA